MAAQRGEPWGNSGSHAPHDGLGDELGQGDRARSPEAKEARLPGSGSHSVVSAGTGNFVDFVFRKDPANNSAENTFREGGTGTGERGQGPFR